MFLTESVSITIHVMKHPPQSKNHTKVIAFSHGLAPYLLWDEHLYHPEKTYRKNMHFTQRIEEIYQNLSTPSNSWMFQPMLRKM